MNKYCLTLNEIFVESLLAPENHEVAQKRLAEMLCDIRCQNLTNCFNGLITLNSPLSLEALKADVPWFAYKEDDGAEKWEPLYVSVDLIS